MVRVVGGWILTGIEGDFGGVHEDFRNRIFFVDMLKMNRMLLQQATVERDQAARVRLSECIDRRLGRLVESV